MSGGATNGMRGDCVKNKINEGGRDVRRECYEWLQWHDFSFNPSTMMQWSMKCHMICVIS